jgi:hypothetical protein
MGTRPKIDLTQLTEPSKSESVSILDDVMVTYIVKIANINDSVTLRFEVAHVDDDAEYANMAKDKKDRVFTENGVYEFTRSNVAGYYTRLNFVSEAGGTDATIDASVYSI